MESNPPVNPFADRLVRKRLKSPSPARSSPAALTQPNARGFQSSSGTSRHRLQVILGFYNTTYDTRVSLHKTHLHRVAFTYIFLLSSYPGHVTPLELLPSCRPRPRIGIVLPSRLRQVDILTWPGVFTCHVTLVRHVERFYIRRIINKLI
jgi:hypothetical protein